MKKSYGKNIKDTVEYWCRWLRADLKIYYIRNLAAGGASSKQRTRRQRLHKTKRKTISKRLLDLVEARIAVIWNGVYYRNQMTMEAMHAAEGNSIKAIEQEKERIRSANNARADVDIEEFLDNETYREKLKEETREDTRTDDLTVRPKRKKGGIDFVHENFKRRDETS